MTTETKHEELVETLITLVGKRQAASIVRADDPLPGSAVRRVHKVNTEIAEFIGANWPEICGTLRNARASDARIAELEAAVRKARGTFEHYGSLHKAKGTVEGEQKSLTNYALAMEMAAALGEQP